MIKKIFISLSHVILQYQSTEFASSVELSEAYERVFSFFQSEEWQLIKNSHVDRKR